MTKTLRNWRRERELIDAGGRAIAFVTVKITYNIRMTGAPIISGGWCGYTEADGHNHLFSYLPFPRRLILHRTAVSPALLLSMLDKVAIKSQKWRNTCATGKNMRATRACHERAAPVSSIICEVPKARTDPISFATTSSKGFFYSERCIVQ